MRFGSYRELCLKEIENDAVLYSVPSSTQFIGTLEFVDEKQIMITRETTIINDLNGIISYQMFGERL